MIPTKPLSIVTATSMRRRTITTTINTRRKRTRTSKRRRMRRRGLTRRSRGMRRRRGTGECGAGGALHSPHREGGVCESYYKSSNTDVQAPGRDVCARAGTKVQILTQKLVQK
jgi:hypothetical protein